MRHLRHFALATALFLAACGGDNGPSTPNAEGSWNGPVNDNTGAPIATLQMTLTETNGTVAGTGNLNNAGTAVAITVTGTFTAPQASLNLAANGFSPINMSVTVGQTNMTGTMNGSGFVNAAVVLTRQ